MDWPLIKWIVETISRKYGDLDVRYYLNTNMTIMSEEIARFFEKHRFDVDISIDGYPGAHDKTRRYYNGKGSFENIIKNLAILRENYKTLQLKAFQGTIDRTDDFECEEVYQMKRYGFTSARLAPNLLYISEEEAIKKARIMGEFLDLNARHDFKVGDGYFDNMKNLINLPQYAFFFNCFGLTGFPKVGLYFNISNLRISQLCNFISWTSVPFKDVDEDIYNPKIWQISSRFIQNRVDTLLKTCMECELVGICRGGCIVNGLDKNNQINKAACAYQKELWKIFLKKVVAL